MISKPLFSREVKANYKILLLVLAIITMYGSIIIAMFDPELGSSLKILAEGMPELFSAFGMSSFSSVLVEFLADMVYGLIFVIIPLILIIILTSRLMSRYIDRGSMAYLLATPNSRGKIVRTQAFVMVLANVAMVIFTILMCIVVSAILFPGELEIGKFLMLNVGLFCLLMFLSGVCFCSSCIFNEARLANGVGIGVTIAFLLIKMLAQTNEKSDWLKYLTPTTLFDTNGLLAFETGAILKSLILLVVGVILYVIAIRIFCKKDLSL